MAACPPDRADAGELRPLAAGGTGSRTGQRQTSGDTTAAGGTRPTNIVVEQYAEEAADLSTALLRRRPVGWLQDQQDLQDSLLD